MQTKLITATEEIVRVYRAPEIAGQWEWRGNRESILRADEVTILNLGVQITMTFVL